MTQILATHTLLPEHAHSAEESMVFYKKWVSSQPQVLQDKAIKIFESAAIKEKHTIAPAEALFTQRTFEESNGLYKEKAIELGTRVLQEALEKANIKPTEIDFVITTSCTGFMIPSFDVYAMNTLGFRNDVVHLPVTEVGCAAGASALIYAHNFLTAHPDKKAAIVTLEFPSNTIQLHDYAIDNIVGTALFADGVACAILGGGKDRKHPHIVDTQMYRVQDTTGILGYNLTNGGLRMNLQKCIPHVIRRHFETIVKPFLEKNRLGMREVDHYLVHPGGIKILDTIEQVLAPFKKQILESRKIMETYGNLSSSTILFILDELLRREIKDQTALMLSFGPGFSAHQLLLKWEA